MESKKIIPIKQRLLSVRYLLLVCNGFTGLSSTVDLEILLQVITYFSQEEKLQQVKIPLFKLIIQNRSLKPFL